MYDAVIIGKGPAGVQAAIYIGRAGFKTLCVYKDKGALQKADAIDNYYGFSETLDADTLLDEGQKQAMRYNVEFIQDEVVHLYPSGNDTIIVKGLKNDYEGSYSIISTGLSRKTLNVPGLKNFEGMGISYCVTCDGFFFRNKKVAIIGYTKYAEHELNDLLMFSSDVYLLTNQKQLEFDTSRFSNVKIIEKPIAAIYGQNKADGVQFKDDTKENFDGIFIAYGTADTSAFCIKSGIAAEKNHILVDRSKMTNIDRIYAAGDCTGAYPQIAVAVGEGALASRSVIERLKSDRKRKKEQA